MYNAFMHVGGGGVNKVSVVHVISKFVGYTILFILFMLPGIY